MKKRNSRKLKGLNLHKLPSINQTKLSGFFGNKLRVLWKDIKQNIFPNHNVTLHPTKGYRKKRKVKNKNVK